MHYRYYHYLNLRKNKLLVKKLLKWLGYFFIAGVIFIAAVFIYFLKDLPDPAKIDQRQIIQSTKIYDRTGSILLYDVHGEEKRTVVSPDQISQYLKDATVAVEDTNFYHHLGIDLKGIVRAFWANLRGKRIVQGGSTITQQFIKSSLLTPEKTISRKIKEAVLSLELERKYSKDQILTFYLNQIPYGSNAYGAEAAAQTFFNKSAKDLTLAQAALLAGLPNAPTYYSPYGSHPEDMKARQEKILDKMAEQGYISKDQAEAAKKEKLEFAPNVQNIKAPHFVMYIKEYLEQKYGADTVEKGGLKVYTTLDWELQQAAQQIVEEGANSNQKKYGAYNAALTAIDPKTGQILAMVGSKDYFAPPLPSGCDPGKTCKFEPNVNVTTRDRQPGSSFKPFAYAVAFQKGFTPNTVLFDLKTEFNPSCPADANETEYNGNTCYNPQNYDGLFRGPVTMRQALAQSLNIPAVKTLYLAGIDKTIDLAHAMGITTLKKPKNYYGLALVLGGGEVKLEDEVAAYSVFANDGVKNPKTAILKIEDGQGKILEQYQPQPQKVLEPQIARLISDILSDNAARAPVFGSTSPLYLGNRPAAVKTGTTQGYRDAWTVGYTPSLAVGVWAGNNNNEPMSKAGAGMAAAAPIWNAFIKKAYEIKTSNQEPITNNFTLPKEPEQFIEPEPIASSTKPILNGEIFGSRTVKIDKISGKLATSLTPPDLIEERAFQEIHSILYYINKDDPLGEAPKMPTNDPQFVNWEAPIQAWANASGFVAKTPPDQQDDIHIPENIPTISIISPSPNQTINQRTINILIQAQARLGIKQIDFFFDNDLIGVKTQAPYNISFTIPDQVIGNIHTIKAQAYDPALNRQSAEINIDVSSVPDIIINPEPAPIPEDNNQATSTLEFY